MSTPFAAIEARANSAVLRRLCNAVAVVDGVDVPVIFEKPFAAPFQGAVDAAALECTGPELALGGLVRGSPIEIGGAAYEVLTAEADGAGFVRLVLGSL